MSGGAVQKTPDLEKELLLAIASEDLNKIRAALESGAPPHSWTAVRGIMKIKWLCPAIGVINSKLTNAEKIKALDMLHDFGMTACPSPVDEPVSVFLAAAKNEEIGQWFAKKKIGLTPDEGIGLWFSEYKPDERQFIPAVFDQIAHAINHGQSMEGFSVGAHSKMIGMLGVACSLSSSEEEKDRLVGSACIEAFKRNWPVVGPANKLIKLIQKDEPDHLPQNSITEMFLWVATNLYPQEGRFNEALNLFLDAMHHLYPENPQGWFKVLSDQFTSDPNLAKQKNGEVVGKWVSVHAAQCLADREARILSAASAQSEAWAARPRL